MLGEMLHFDSWMVLCEHIMEVAEKEANKQLYETYIDLVSKIADEIIATAEEYAPIESSE